VVSIRNHDSLGSARDIYEQTTFVHIVLDGNGFDLLAMHDSKSWQVNLQSALTFLGWGASAFYYPLN
jgi:hypothetical protein